MGVPKAGYGFDAQALGTSKERSSHKPTASTTKTAFKKDNVRTIRILRMGSLGVQNGDDWIAAQATIVSTKKRLLPWKYGGEMDYPLPEYVVTFSYKAGSRAMTGKYVTTSPQERGHMFDIFYDPKHPNRNTGLDELINPWAKWTARVLGLGAAIVAIWLWGDKEWFQY